MSSPREPTAAATAHTTSAPAAAIPAEPLPENVEAENDADYAFGGSNDQSYVSSSP